MPASAGCSPPSSPSCSAAATSFWSTQSSGARRCSSATGPSRPGRSTITYTELNGVAQGRGYLETEHGEAPQELDDELGLRLLWTAGGATDGIYELDVMYADAPFAVEVRARSEQARDDALDSLIRFRAADHIAVRP